MSVLPPLADPGAPLAGRNPVAKLGAAMLLTLGLLATLDPVTPALALVAELALAPLFGVDLRALARRGWPLLASAAGALLTMLLFAAGHGGQVLLHAGPLVITTGTVTVALALALRVIAVALPGVIVFATTDPTDLADALVQNVRAPARFAIGALAAFRLVPLLREERRMLSLARRARGVDAGRNPVARLRLFASLSFALLVGAIRRGTQLATAMDARGFDSGRPRTFARRQRFGPADALLMLAAAGLAAALLAAAIALGTFRPIL
jgi:energy-coupling factor transport system permease protein